MTTRPRRRWRTTARHVAARSRSFRSTSPRPRVTGSAAMRAGTKCGAPQWLPARAKRSIATPPTIRPGRTTSRRACARHSGHCASACGCGGPRPSCRAPRAACTASPSPRTSMARVARWATCRSTPRRWSPASCSRTSARRSSSSPIRRSTTPSSSRTSAYRRRPACRSGSCPRRSTAFASSVSTCPGSACRPMPRRRTCWRGRCSSTRARKRSWGPCRRRAPA